jgi:hypothetical protein
MARLALTRAKAHIDREVSLGHSRAMNPAGIAASKPRVPGLSMKEAPKAPVRVPIFQRTNTDKPVAQNAWRARCGSSGWERAIAVLSSIVS